jgi:D-alanyl-D-alanine carboxypeptidase/D-alanyl-D-alanine-endopeptidase (penicillin-binding protein 4)
MKIKFRKLILLLVILVVTSCKNNDTVSPSNTIGNNQKTEKNIKEKKIKPKKVIDNFLQLDPIQNASVGIKVVNLDKNKVLYEKNQEISLVPASNMKLITTGIALETLGKDYRFKTTITYDGEIKADGTLDGNIYIIGGGDPTLGSKYLVAKNPEGRITDAERKKQIEFLMTWVEEIKELGIKKINGKVIADPSYLPETTLSPTWEWGDLRYYFASYPSGLTFMDNNIRLILRKDGDKIKAEINPKYSKTKITNKVVVDKDEKTKITVVAVPYSNEIITLGVLNKGIASYTTVMQDPASTLATLFSTTLKRSGIDNRGGELRSKKNNIEKYEENQDMKEIYINYSPKLEKIVALTNKYSINLFAEHLKLEIEKNNSKKIKSLWSENIDVDGMYIYDGSGLSRYDGVTPNNIIDVLKYMHRSSEFDVFYNSLAKPGENGTFKEFEKDTVLIDNLRAKSGTLTGVKSYSGYMYNKDGNLIAFCILVNHHGMSGKAIGKELEKVMESFYYLK